MIARFFLNQFLIRFTVFAFIFIFVVGISETYSQKLLDVLHRSVAVYSQSDSDGYTSNTMDFNLPRGTEAYVVRLSFFKMQEIKLGDRLIDLLKAHPELAIKPTTDFSTLNSANGSDSADFYVFTSTKDAEVFFQGEERKFPFCKEFPKSTNFTFATDECLTSRVWFGFKNNHLTRNLDIVVEVVAMVDEDQGLISQSLNAYKITNNTTAQVKFSLSLDGINWLDYALESGEARDYNYNEAQLFMTLPTPNVCFSQFKIQPNQKYKVSYNADKGKLELQGYH
jgi:hypothetical protein